MDKQYELPEWVKKGAQKYSFEAFLVRDGQFKESPQRYEETAFCAGAAAVLERLQPLIEALEHACETIHDEFCTSYKHHGLCDGPREALAKWNKDV